MYLNSARERYIVVGENFHDNRRDFTRSVHESPYVCRSKSGDKNTNSQLTPPPLNVFP